MRQWKQQGEVSQWDLRELSQATKGGIFVPKIYFISLFIYLLIHINMLSKITFLSKIKKLFLVQ